MEPPISDHPWCLRLRWSLTGGGYLTGSFTNSNLTEGGSNWDFGCWSLTRGGHSARQVPVYYSVHKNKQIIKNRAKFKIVSGSTFRVWIAVALKIDKFVRFVRQKVLSTRTCHPPYKTLKHRIFHYSKWWCFGPYLDIFCMSTVANTYLPHYLSWDIEIKGQKLVILWNKI